MDSQDHVLLLVYINTHFKEQIRVARALVNSKKFRPIVIFCSDYPTIENDIDCLQKQSILYERLYQYTAPIDTTIKPKILYPSLSQPMRIASSVQSNINKYIKPLQSKVVSSSKTMLNPLRKVSLLKSFYRKVKKLINFRTIGFEIKRKILAPLQSNVVSSSITMFNSFKKISLRKYLYRKVKKLIILKTIWFNFKRKILYFIDNSLILRYVLIYPLSFCAKNISFAKRILQKLLIKISNTRYIKSVIENNGFFIRGRFYEYFIPHLITKFQAKLLIFPENNLFYLTQYKVYLAKKANIPSIIVPFTIANTKEWCESFYKVPSYEVNFSNLNYLFASLFHQWVMPYKNKRLILPPLLILFHERLNLTPNNPWLINDGLIDFIAVESKQMKLYYEKSGIMRERLIPTGSLYNDDLNDYLKNSERHKSNILQELHLNDDEKPILSVALPPNQMDSRSSYTEFKSYQEAMIFWLESLSELANQYHIIINLHPRINIDDIDFIKNYPVHIYPETISNLIPVSDIFIASCSATIRMAIACAKPVLNYDFYEYGYDDYQDVKGVITVSKKSDFLNKLKEMTQDSAYYHELVNLQKIESLVWNNKPGRASDYLLQSIHKLLDIGA